MSACADILREIRFLQAFLSSARVSASHLRNMYSSRSHPINFIHISFWPPLHFFTFLSASFSASLVGVCSFNLRRWSYNFILTSLITSLHSLSFYLLWSSTIVICLANICWRFSWLPLFERYQFPLQVVWSRSTILNCIGGHCLCRILEFLFLVSLMLTCFPEYFSVCCKLLLLKFYVFFCI